MRLCQVLPYLFIFVCRATGVPSLIKKAPLWNKVHRYLPEENGWPCLVVIWRRVVAVFLLMKIAVCIKPDARHRSPPSKHRLTVGTAKASGANLKTLVKLNDCVRMWAHCRQDIFIVRQKFPLSSNVFMNFDFLGPWSMVVVILMLSN